MKMKKYIFVIAFIWSFTLSNEALAQCNADGFRSQCVSRLADGFTFIKSYNLNDKKINSKGEIEYSFVFSKGTLYMLTFANALGEMTNIEIKLYDPTHKLIVSNFNKKTKKYFPLGYPCKATGVHYMSFKFADGGQTCGLSVLGFKRQ